MYPDNATLEERVWFYLSSGDDEKAQALAYLHDFLEDCLELDAVDHP